MPLFHACNLNIEALSLPATFTLPTTCHRKKKNKSVTVVSTAKLFCWNIEGTHCVLHIYSRDIKVYPQGRFLTQVEGKVKVVGKERASTGRAEQQIWNV